MPAGLSYCLGHECPGQSHLARDGAELRVRVTSNTASNRIVTADGMLRVYVTTVPEDGKANAAVKNLFSKALGLPKSRLRWLRRQTARDKLFVFDGF